MRCNASWVPDVLEIYSGADHRGPADFSLSCALDNMVLKVLVLLLAPGVDLRVVFRFIGIW